MFLAMYQLHVIKRLQLIVSVYSMFPTWGAMSLAKGGMAQWTEGEGLMLVLPGAALLLWDLAAVSTMAGAGRVQSTQRVSVAVCLISTHVGT